MIPNGRRPADFAQENERLVGDRLVARRLAIYLTLLHRKCGGQKLLESFAIELEWVLMPGSATA